MNHTIVRLSECIILHTLAENGETMKSIGQSTFFDLGRLEVNFCSACLKTGAGIE
jgi:hypothetical protein